MKRLLMAVFGIGTACLANAGTLTWNGSSGAAWDTTTANWLDENGTATVWTDGSDAVFYGTGGMVSVADGIRKAASVSFESSGYSILGYGYVQTSTLSSGVGTMNAVLATLIADGTLSKTGEGSVAVASCRGRFNVTEGTVFAAGSKFRDADVTVAPPAMLQVLGNPAATNSLIVNGSFEAPTLSGGTWKYLDANNPMDGWTWNSYVGIQNVTTATPWSDAGMATDGNQLAIIQYDGTIEQTVTVSTSGFYCLSLDFFKRKGYGSIYLYALLDGLPLSSIYNDADQKAHGTYVSGAIWLASGTHTVRISGEPGWGDRSSIIDNVRLSVPAPTETTTAFGGDSVLRGTGSVTLNYTGSIALAKNLFTGPMLGTGTLGLTTKTVYLSAGTPGVWSAATFWNGTAPVAGGLLDSIFLFPGEVRSITMSNDLGGSFSGSDLIFSGVATDDVMIINGNEIMVTNSVDRGRIIFNGAGTAMFSAPLTTQPDISVDTVGTVSFSGTLNVRDRITKEGPGTMGLGSRNPSFSIDLHGGTVIATEFSTNRLTQMVSSQGSPVKHVVELTAASQSFNQAIEFRGSSLSTLSLKGAGKTVTQNAYINGIGESFVMDVVAADSTFSTKQMESYACSRNGYARNASTLLKTGAGTFEIRERGIATSSGTIEGFRGSYGGQTTIRNGYIRILVDDDAAATVGGALGIDYTYPLIIGDSGTAATDNLGLIGGAGNLYSGRAINVNAFGNTAVIGTIGDSFTLGGKVTLARDLTITGSAASFVALNDLALPNRTSTAIVDATGGPQVFVTTIAAGISIIAPNGFSVKDGAVASVSFAALTAGGLVTVEFGTEGNDVATVGTLTLANATSFLLRDTLGNAFTESGTYTLFNYTDTFTGDVSTLTIANASTDCAYAFANDTENKRITLTVSPAADGKQYVWRSLLPGTWETALDWDRGVAPNAADLSALFGLAITSNLTVTVESAKTIGTMTFNNQKSYLLTGANISLAGTSTAVKVLAGKHEIDNALASASAIPVSTVSGASITFGGAVANGITAAAGSTVGLAKQASLGASTFAAGSALSVAAGANATLTDPTAVAGTSIVIPSGATGTVFSANATTIASMISGTGSLSKAGSATLSLTTGESTFSGALAVNAGTLSLASSRIPSATTVASGATLSSATPSTGLIGVYYEFTGTPSSTPWTSLSALETFLADNSPVAAYSLADHLTVGTFNIGADNWPAPYKNSGTHPNYFAVVWRGILNIPATGAWAFQANWDDFYLLAVDGQALFASSCNTTNVFRTAGMYLNKGDHDIVVSLLQATGSAYTNIRLSGPGYPGQNLPLNWLRPASSVALAKGSGTISTESKAGIRLNPSKGLGTFAGTLAGPSGSLFTQGGVFGFQEMPATAFGGGVGTLGALAFDGSSFTAATPLSIGPSGTLALVGDNAGTSLSGGGQLGIGGGAYVAQFKDETDCGISSSKTYTHLVDFPVGSFYPTINGVTFNNRGSYSGFPTGNWNSNSSTREGALGPDTNAGLSPVGSLLWDFCYGAQNYTATIGGLTNGKLYDFRFYFKNFGNNDRVITVTFKVDGVTVGEATWNPDSTLQRSIIGCRYRAGSSGALSVSVHAKTSKDTMHIYAFSNEEVSSSATSDTLTLTPAAGTEARYNGAIAGSGTLALNGSGVQYFGGMNTLARPLSVASGNVILTEGASVTSGVAIADGAIVSAYPGKVYVGGLSGSGIFNVSGVAPRISQVFFTGDADCGISSTKTYTHAIDCGSGPVAGTINGVKFTSVTAASGTDAVTGKAFSGITGSAHNGGEAPSIITSNYNSIYNLLYDMIYGPNMTITISGLTVGKRYDFRFYLRKWEKDTDCTRRVKFTFDVYGLNNTYTFEMDRTNDNYLSYRYTASATSLSITMNALTDAGFHCYGFTNEEVTDGSDVTVGSDANSEFAGTISGSGSWTKVGTGTLTVTGVGTANGPLTIAQGKLMVDAGGTATLGPVDVLKGAALWGNGLVGGDVAVATNAVICGCNGTSAGTLSVGGALTLSLGSILRLAYGANGYGSIHAAGAITIPATGVIDVNAWTAGRHCPARAKVLSSDTSISGPADFSGWQILQGGVPVPAATLSYGDDGKSVYLTCPNGTITILR